MRLRQGNALDLDVDTLGQLVHGDAGTGGLVDEVLLVLVVHGGEVCHVGQEDVDLDDLVDAGAGSLEDLGQVLDALVLRERTSWLALCAKLSPEPPHLQVHRGGGGGGQVAKKEEGETGDK